MGRNALNRWRRTAEKLEVNLGHDDPKTKQAWAIYLTMRDREEAEFNILEAACNAGGYAEHGGHYG